MIGHLAVREYLEKRLPVATLLVGPASVGKWTLANHVAEHYRVKPIDRWNVEHGFTMETVRLITAYAARAPHGAFKLVQARLDGSSREALHALLKTLEEPPPQVRFLLVADSQPLATIASRCVVFELGILPPTELEAIYRDQGYSTVKAHDAAAHARGQVARGYEYTSAAEPRALVVVLARALATGDRDMFDTVFRDWDARASELLTVFFTECLTHKWGTFSEQDTGGLHQNRARLWKMVAALHRLSGARPRLGVRAALEPFLAQR